MHSALIFPGNVGPLYILKKNSSPSSVDGLLSLDWFKSWLFAIESFLTISLFTTVHRWLISMTIIYHITVVWTICFVSFTSTHSLNTNSFLITISNMVTREVQLWKIGLYISCQEAHLSQVMQYSSRKVQFFPFEAKGTSKIMEYWQGLLRL